MRLAVMLDLERAARNAASRDDLGYVIVNDTGRLLPYRQAALFLASGRKRFKVRAISGVSAVDRKAPFVDWIERVAAGIAKDASEPGVRVLAAPADDDGSWEAFSAPNVAWVPLKDRAGRRIGALWMARESVWADVDLILAEQLAGAYSHALIALGGRRTLRRFRPAPVLAAGLALVCAAAFVPVPRTALAPAEVAARDPVVVSAPLDGVIERIVVSPNQAVSVNDPLVQYDRASLQASSDVARQALAVAEAELLRARQATLSDQTAAARVEGLAAEADLRRTQFAYAEEQLSRVTVRAGRAGIAIFGDTRDWAGRPVRVGERIMEIADPSAVELRIELPVGTAIDVAAGQAVRMYLDIDPVHPLDAVLQRVGYAAVERPGGGLAYGLTAELHGGGPPPRIGLRGTAKIVGGDVPLALFLFARPLAALRQRIGL